MAQMRSRVRCKIGPNGTNEIAGTMQREGPGQNYKYGTDLPISVPRSGKEENGKRTLFSCLVLEEKRERIKLEFDYFNLLLYKVAYVVHEFLNFL